MNKRLKSEQLPTDGHFRMHEILDAANERLSKLGKHGKRCKLKRTSNKVVLQFNFDGQKQKSNDWSFTNQGIAEAEKIAALVTGQLTANQFSMEWLDSLLGKKKALKKEKQLTCAEMIAEYKGHWFKENRKLKSPQGSWNRRFNHLENTFSQTNNPIDIEAIRKVIDETENNTPTRGYTLQALILFLEYFSINTFDKQIKQYKDKNKPKKKTKYVPSDNEIINVYNFGFKVKPKSAKKYRYRYAQWQFLYGLLATYGLRIHEAWNIANWDKPVILKDGDWVEVGLEKETEKEDIFKFRHRGKNEIIPAIINPDNKVHILAIKHDTKTGYRMAMPLSPTGHNWLAEFDLIGDLRLPDITNPYGYSSLNQKTFHCSTCTCKWFYEHKYGFTPHALRHAYNHRAHQQGLNPKLIADSLGHSLAINQSTYLESMNTSRQVQMMKEAISEVHKEQSEIDKLREENKYLKAENEKLKTELKMYEALKNK